MASPRPKMTYVLPLYDSRTGSHFFHIYEMLLASVRELDIFLVIERAAETPGHLSFPVYCQRFHWAPLRFIELLAVLFIARFHGRQFFYTHYSFFGGAASWLVAFILGGTAYYWNAGMPWLYRRGRFEEMIFRFVLSHTILVTGTETLASEYAERYGLKRERTRVMPNCIHLARFGARPSKYEARSMLGIEEGAPVVLFVHRLSRRKGSHLLPDIIAGVLEREKRAIFIVVGDGPERKNLERALSGKGLADRVRIIGEVPHRDIVKYFRSADVFLMPSEEEGFPHVLLEAMATGVPYVASDVGGVRDITPPELKNSLVTVREAHVFAETLLELISLPRPAVLDLAEAERQWVRRFDLATVQKVFCSLFI